MEGRALAHTGPPQGPPVPPPQAPLPTQGPSGRACHPPAGHAVAPYSWRGGAIRSHVIVRHLLWGQGQTIPNKMTSEAPVSSKTLGAFLSNFLVNYFLINNKANTAATGKLKK